MDILELEMVVEQEVSTYKNELMMYTSQRVREKVKAFEFLVSRLIVWYKEQNPKADFTKNDLSKLKVLKLHFFICASRADENEDGLLRLFDNFCAMPYGHVESDIYENLDNLQLFKINSQKLNFLEGDADIYFSDLDPTIQEDINLSIAAVKFNNKELINYMAVDLVELSHTWYSWKSMYKLARSFQKYSLKIPIEIIKSEKKFYSL